MATETMKRFYRNYRPYLGRERPNEREKGSTCKLPGPVPVSRLARNLSRFSLPFPLQHLLSSPRPPPLSSAQFSLSSHSLSSLPHIFILRAISALSSSRRHYLCRRFLNFQPPPIVVRCPADQRPFSPGKRSTFITYPPNTFAERDTFNVARIASLVFPHT
jgi:hypothetical protein